MYQFATHNPLVKQTENPVCEFSRNFILTKLIETTCS